ncbi:ABC transporter ATP-binding protein [Streptomyces cinnamoneus]
MTEPTTPLAEARGLAIRLPGGPVLLPPTDLTLAPGTVTALTGPSGSGKTTLLRALAGALPPRAEVAAGTLTVLGHDVLRLPAAELRALRRHRIAHVGQDPASALNPRMRVRRIVTELAGTADAGTAARLLAECRLDPRDGLLERRPGALSGGQQRRVALARALARAPEVLLLDEPTAGLDHRLRDEIADLLRELATARHIGVLLTCHDPGLVDRCADHAVALTSPHHPAPRAATPEPAAPAIRAATAPSSTAPRSGGLTARGLRVTFDRRRTGRPALADVDFTAPAGTTTALIGASGSGKTTLLRVLAGLRRPDGGTLTLAGAPLPTVNRKRTGEQRRGIQLVPQNPLGCLNPARTVGAIVARPLTLHRTVPAAAVPGRVARLLEDVGLSADHAHRRPAELSGGQRQRVALARALAPGPEVLLCDEITSALDPDTAHSVMRLLARIQAAHGLTVVLVSHELHLVAAYADTVHLLDGGRVTHHGPTADVLDAALPGRR